MRLQGATLLGRHFLNTNDFLAFTTGRTLVNAMYSASAVINGSVWPELTQALALNDLAAARRLHRGALALTGTMMILFALGLAAWGPMLLTYWTRGEVTYDRTVFGIQLAATAVYSTWQASSVVSVAVNTFGVIALNYVLSSFLALVAGFGLVRTFGSAGLAFSAFIVDAMMIGVVLPRSLALTSDSLASMKRTIKANLVRALGRR